MTALMTVKQVADLLQVTPAWVRAHAEGRNKPVLPGFKDGPRWWFWKEQVEAWQSRYRWHGGKGA